MDNFQVAIDGPVGVGKSTVARLTAQRAGFLYIDSGALYRAAALYVRRALGEVPGNEEAVAELLPNIVINLSTTSDGQKVFLNGEDVTAEIRSPEETRGSSAVAVFPSVRVMVTGRARELAAGGSVVMDGRDVGTAVLPTANLKIYLDASVEIRARRRFNELEEKGQNPDYDALLNDIIRRDYNDTHRETDPLRKADDAVTIDSGNMGIDEVVETILELIASRGGKIRAV